MLSQFDSTTSEGNIITVLGQKNAISVKKGTKRMSLNENQLVNFLLTQRFSSKLLKIADSVIKSRLKRKGMRKIAKNKEF